MGVYIPPESGGNGQGLSDGGKSGGSGGNRGGSGGGGITIPNPAAFIPRNPSIGLKLWGPLVPASDNLPALYSLTALQVGIGLLGLHKARQLRRANLARLSIANTWGRKFNKWVCALAGSYLVFQSGLEMTRLSLPYDPWYDEAKEYRKLAIKNGDSPSWWFGATSYYKPMNFTEWNSKVDKWIENQANIIEVEEDKSQKKSISISFGKKNDGPSPALSNLAKKGKYAEIYLSLHENNANRFQALLKKDLKDVNELNKAQRLDLIMEGKSKVKYNEDYLKPHIQLGNHRIDSDEEFEMVWLNFEPWDELRSETDYDIRLVPRWRWQEDEDAQEFGIDAEPTSIEVPLTKEADETHL